MIDRKTIAAALGKIEAAGPSFPVFPAASVDSRTVGEGEFFIPLPGERTDGHLFITDALRRGAGGFLVSASFYTKQQGRLRRIAKKHGVPFVIVEDTLKALQNMALFHMETAGRSVKRIGVTGSNGKTTTKELIGGILSAYSACFVSRGNLNSEIGLCLEALRLSGSEEYAVFEMGMNRRGEMDVLAGIVDPDFAVITNIGTAHIGLLGSRDAIVDEKKKIFSRFDGEQTGFVYEDEPYYTRLVEGVKGKILLYGRKSLNDIKDVKDLGAAGSLISCIGGDIRFPLIGEHNRRNCYAAFALAKEIGVPFDIMKKSLEKARPLFGRGEIIRGDVLLILDCYNANYESMVEGLRFLQALPGVKRKLAVLGDMKELGEFSRESHLNLAKTLSTMGLDGLFLYGPEMEAAFGEFNKLKVNGSTSVDWTDSFETLAELIRKHLKKGDALLIKGSRSMELEKLREFINGIEEVEK